jgi:lysine-specific histone demethylase 1
MIGGREQANYNAVRNHILTRWRSYISAWLTRGHALESIWAELKAIVDSAYNFLRQHGNINFGMARAIEEAQVKLNDGVEELMRLLLARDSPGWLQPDSQWLWALKFLFWKGMRGQVGV